jgi:hypothetical protein
MIINPTNKGSAFDNTKNNFPKFILETKKTKEIRIAIITAILKIFLVCKSNL